jgi:RNA polymerase sigma factor for flagellar operon FliA
MKHDHQPFAAASARHSAVSAAYAGHVGDRVQRFLPMVRRLAWHVNGSGRPGIELEDLMQAGLVALTECAQRHEGPNEDGFAAYAKMRVRGAMVDLVRRHAPISRGANERRKRLEAASRELEVTLGRPPDSAELAEALGIGLAELADLRDASQPMRFESIDAVYSDHDAAYADDEPDSHALLEAEETREALIAAIADLPDRLQLVVQLYFVEELNLSDIAEVLEVSVPRVHQLKAQAMGKLRASLEHIADVL